MTRVPLTPNLSLITPDLARRRVRVKTDDASTAVSLELHDIVFDQNAIIINGIKLLAKNLPERIENVCAAFLLSNGLFDSEGEQWELLFVQ